MRKHDYESVTTITIQFGESKLSSSALLHLHTSIDSRILMSAPDSASPISDFPQTGGPHYLLITVFCTSFKSGQFLYMYLINA